MNHQMPAQISAFILADLATPEHAHVRKVDVHERQTVCAGQQVSVLRQVRQEPAVNRNPSR